jgi:hypothetical protein
MRLGTPLWFLIMYSIPVNVYFRYCDMVPLPVTIFQYYVGAHTKRLRTKRLLDKTSPYKTSPQQNVSVTERLL